MHTSVAKTLVLVGVLLASTLAACTRSENVTLTIRVHTTPESVTDSVFAAGNTVELGEWNPKGVAFTRVDSTTFEANIPVEAAEPIEFKVTRGAWANQALNPDGTVPDNRTLTARSDTTVVITVTAWHNVKGGITGNTRLHQDLGREGIASRDIIVWLPPGYDVDTNKRYPVLYVHDGQNVFDPSTSYTLVDWQIDEHADSLITSGSMESIIVVAVNNTTHRSDEYGDTDLGRRYLRFLAEDLKPMIDANYRTRSDRNSTVIMGSSMGGLISFLAVWLHPETFSAAACLSPYFPDDLPSRIERSDWPSEAVRIYVDNGGDELDTFLQEGIDRMLPVLRAKGFEDGRNFIWRKFPDDRHNEAAWAARVRQPLLFLFGNDRTVTP